MSSVEAIFDSLQKKSVENVRVKDEIKAAVEEVDDAYRICARRTARIHSYNAAVDADSRAFLGSVSESLDESVAIAQSKVKDLIAVVSKYPFYKYNGVWTHGIQNVVYVSMMAHIIRSLSTDSQISLLAPSEITAVFGCPFESDFESPPDVFHLTCDEYLQAVVSVSNELARLAITSVTAGFTSFPKKIEIFVKEIQASFMALNLKNDSLRRRFDSLKYDVKKVEEVVYDLAVRGVAV
ncbi:translin [Sugiyamaella lignohabitans]|uniref:Translin n=1 Tax=Sugiyamaella lignohabitans TaxID=796027 RepID=A0A167DS64_9ASCO|nr:translin [Sugiyamaella lignohabitans]ANB13228.1 translin [Sugiyamaella lignohabitans]